MVTRGVANQLVEAWLLLAALGQLVYLAQWPMQVWGFSVPALAAVIVALARLGVYTGLAWGLREGNPVARAAAIVELLRSFVLFVVLVRLWGLVLAGSVYPAGWCQGLFGGALPFLVVVNAAIASGWSPGAGIEIVTAWVAGGLAIGLYAAALLLRQEARQAAAGGDAPTREAFWLGLAFPLLLTGIEGAAVLAAWRLGP